MSKSVAAVITALVLIAVLSFGGFTYIQGFVYKEYNTRNYDVATEVNGDETKLIFTLDKNEAYSDTKYKKQTVLPDDFGDDLYGTITIRPEATKNDDGTYALDEDGNYQYADWSTLGASQSDNSEMDFLTAIKYVREGKSLETVQSEYTYTDNGDTVTLTVLIKGYEFADGDNIHIEVDNDITMAGLKVNNNSLALTNVEFKNGSFSEVENMFVNSVISE